MSYRQHYLPMICRGYGLLHAGCFIGQLSDDNKVKTRMKDEKRWCQRKLSNFRYKKTSL